jgi:hypothetical protein
VVQRKNIGTFEIGKGESGYDGCDSGQDFIH